MNRHLICANDDLNGNGYKVGQDWPDIRRV